MNEFIKKDGNIIVNCDHAEAYIPADMFDGEDRKSAIASRYGEGYNILGIFNMRVSNSSDEKDIRSQKLRTFNFPNMIITYPSETTNSTAGECKLLDSEEGGDTKYKVFHYMRGDIMMDAQVHKDNDNVTKFLDVITKGKLPPTLKYNDVLTAWLTNISSNGADARVPSMYIQCIISELYRSRKNPSKPFRMVYGKDMTSNDYVVTNMRGAAAYSSVFASQSFEDLGRMLTTSVNTSRRDIPQSISPIEKVLYM